MGRINYSELPLKEGEVLIEHNHKIVEINGDVVEMKYCPHCREWHYLSDYQRSSSAKDGLQSWCRDCVKEYSRTRNAIKKSDDAIIKAANPSVEEQKEENDFYSEGMEFISKMQVRDNERNQEITRLKEEIRSLKDKSISLESLSEREIEIVLKSNKIAPRLLFEAISRQDDRYTFYAVDKVTGLTSTIKIDKKIVA